MMLLGSPLEMSSVGILFRAVVIAVGVLAMKSHKNVYAVCLASSSGEADAVVNTNRKRIVNIVTAINEAIIQRA
jgi:hypothetical protein